MTQGDGVFLSAVVLIKILRSLCLKICISPFPPSEYEREELQSHLVCCFPQQRGLKCYVEHRLPKCWLSSREVRSALGKWWV